MLALLSAASATTTVTAPLVGSDPGSDWTGVVVVLLAILLILGALLVVNQTSRR